MQTSAHQRLLRRGPAPEIVIDAGWNRLRPGHSSDAGPPFVAEAASADDFSNVTLAQPLNGFGNPMAGPTLCSGLDDTIVFSRRLNYLSTLPNLVRDRFFDVHILAGLDRPYRAKRMPVVRCRE